MAPRTMLGAAGVTVMDTSDALVTTRVVCAVATPITLALKTLIVVVPGLTGVAFPLESIVATDVFDEFQLVDDAVTSCVDLSE